MNKLHNKSLTMDIDKYEIQSDIKGHIFTFISEGQRDIIKVVRYDKERIIYKDLDGKMIKVFNLGFGDKKTSTFGIDDLARSNNGDMYIVFNTVLYTIPVFFSKVKNAAIHIRGADKTRHLAYHRFLNQRLGEFSIEYSFYGSINGIIHTFIKGTIYDYIVVF